MAKGIRNTDEPALTGGAKPRFSVDLDGQLPKPTPERAFTADGQPIRQAAKQAFTADGQPIKAAAGAPSAAGADQALAAGAAGQQTPGPAAFNADGQPISMKLPAAPGLDKPTLLQVQPSNAKTPDKRKEEELKQVAAALKTMNMSGPTMTQHYLFVKNSWDLAKQKFAGTPLIAFSPAKDGCKVELLEKTKALTMKSEGKVSQSLVVEAQKVIRTASEGPGVTRNTLYDMDGRMLDDKYVGANGEIVPDKKMDASAAYRPQARK
jgi:hypothetical protein